MSASNPIPSPTGKRAAAMQFALAATVVLLTLTALGVLLWDIDRDMREHWLERAKLIAALLDPAEIAALTATPADLDRPGFQELSARLARAREAFPELRYIYLMRLPPAEATDPQAQVPVFLLDVQNEALEETPPSLPGEPFPEASPELLSVFATGRGLVEGPVSDRWGRWVSALAPLSGAQVANGIGGTHDLIGLDIEANHWYATLALHAAPALVLASALLIGMGILFRVWHARDRAEHELRAERDLFSSGPVCTLSWRADRHWSVLRASSNAEAVLGYSATEMCAPGFRYTEQVHPEDWPEVQGSIAQHIQQGPDFFVQSYRLRRPDGGYRWLQDFTRIIREPSGEVREIHGYLFDQSPLHDIEQTLLQERQRLTGIVEGTRVGTWEWQVQTGATVFNERWAEIVGHRLEDLQPTTIKTWTQFVHHEDLPVCERLLAEHFRGERDFYECESRLRHKDGHWVWVLDRGRVYSWSQDQPPKPLLMLGTHQDITARKHTEILLREKNEELDRYFAYSLDLLVIADLEGHFLRLNPEWERILGHPIETLIGRSFFEFIHADDIAATEAAVRDLDQGEMVFGFENRYRCHDGDYVWLEWRARVHEGRNYAVARDITDRKRTEEALTQANERMRLAADAARFGVWDYDIPSGRLDWDPWMHQLYGTDPDGFQGQFSDWRDALHPEDVAQAEADVQATLRGEHDLSTEFRIIQPNGDVRRLKAVAQVQRDASGQAVRMTGINYDITERWQAEQAVREANQALKTAIDRANALTEQAQSANRAKSEFLANMSHEIRTPMNGVIGMTSLLLETPLNPEQHQYAEIIRSSGESLMTVINDILDFSKVEAGKLELETLEFDLQELLDDFAATLALRAHEKQLEFVCDLAADIPIRLRGDPGRLRQILTNLVGNAIKFTQAGAIDIQVRRAAQQPPLAPAHEKPALRLRFSIRDTGIGIPPEKLDGLFQKFTQVDASTTRRFGGTGLGLAIARQLTELMHGTIGVSSQPGEGSTFWFEVELQPSHCAPEQPAKPTAGETVADLAKRRVLIVDDHDTNRQVLMRRLSGWNMRPCDTPDGASALRLLYQAIDEQDPFALALIDLQMPGMDGDALGRAIRTDPRFADLRLVILPSMTHHGDANRFMEIGFDAWLAKPLRHQTLKQLLERLWSGSGSGTPNRDPPERRDRTPPAPLAAAPANCHARVLLAEDNSINQQVAQGLLRRLGVHADAVADGAEALEAVRLLPYDLVLMDVQMPVLDGLEATRRIRDPAEGALNPRIPIIALTAHAMAGDRTRCLEAGMNDYLSKPLSAAAVASVLERWLPEHHTAMAPRP